MNTTQIANTPNKHTKQQNRLLLQTAIQYTRSLQPRSPTLLATIPITMARIFRLLEQREVPPSWFGSSAVIGGTAYFKSHQSKKVFTISVVRGVRDVVLSPILYTESTIVSIGNKLIAVGGKKERRGISKQEYSNTLHSYALGDDQGNKDACLPPMPTKRCYPAAVYAENMLVVAGGETTGQNPSPKVEILNTASRQWSEVSSLPKGMFAPSAIFCNSQVYVHARIGNNEVYTCSLKKLVESKPADSVWKKITSLPLHYSSLVTVNGQVLAVGGREAIVTKPQRYYTIYEYSGGNWSLLSRVDSTPREALLSQVNSTPREAAHTAAVPFNFDGSPGYKLIVMGGRTTCRTVDIIEYMLRIL